MTHAIATAVSSYSPRLTETKPSDLRAQIAPGDTPAPAATLEISPAAREALAPSLGFNRGYKPQPLNIIWGNGPNK